MSAPSGISHETVREALLECYAILRRAAQRAHEQRANEEAAETVQVSTAKESSRP